MSGVRPFAPPFTHIYYSDDEFPSLFLVFSFKIRWSSLSLPPSFVWRWLLVSFCVLVGDSRFGAKLVGLGFFSPGGSSFSFQIQNRLVHCLLGGSCLSNRFRLRFRRFLVFVFCCCLFVIVLCYYSCLFCASVCFCYDIRWWHHIWLCGGLVA